MRGKRDEIYQVGIELIGSCSSKSDIEMVQLAAESLQALDYTDYRIEICHIGYFKAIMDNLDASQEIKEEIRASIEQKNYAALNDLLQPFETNRAAKALKYLPRLFGGEEVFSKAYALFDNEDAKKTLDYLKNIYSALQELGLKDKVIVDLGLVNQAEYYTGVIFRGYFGGVGEPVLSGGRYDNLLGDFGAQLPAVGFAVNLDIAVDTFHLPKDIPEVLVFADGENYIASLGYTKALTEKGIRAEACVFDSPQQAREYALTRGIRQLHLYGKELLFHDI